MNRVILIGRTTKEMEVRYTSGNNTAVASFTLAVNRRGAKEGQPQADFINCQAWAKTAESIAKYVAKGQQIAVEGRMQNRSWDDKDGKKHYVTEVIVESWYFADGKRGEAAPAHSSGLGSNDGFNPLDGNDDELPFN